ncbi:MAG: cold shock domain-containing protein, partial [Chitinophagales bacterium]
MARVKVSPTPEASTYFIDATNICHWGKSMSLQALLRLLLEIKRKKQSFFCIFDANTSYYIPDNEKKIYKKLLEHTEHFYQVSGGKRADDFILELADRHGSAVISNDNYSDSKYSKYKWKDREAEPMRLFMGEVIPVPSGSHLILFDLDINVVLTEPSDKLYRKLHRILYPPREKFEGKVKFVNNHKGWGRIVYQIEDEVNFRTAELPQTVEQGQKVNFVIEETEKGDYARSIGILKIDEKRIKGRVTQFDENRGMGIIQPEEGGEDLFFYKSYFADPENVPKINKTQRVSYVLGTNSKGDCAKKIELEADDPRDVQIKLLKDRTKYLEDKLRNKEDEVKRLKQGGVSAERSKDNKTQRPAQKQNNAQPKKAVSDKKTNVDEAQDQKGGDKPQGEVRKKPVLKKSQKGKKVQQNNKPNIPSEKDANQENVPQTDQKKTDESVEQNQNKPKKVVLKKGKK